MPKFKHSRERKSKRDSKDSYSKRDTSDRRDYRRKSGSYSRKRRDLEMTKVTCSSCGIECEVPFKPTSTKPVYCRDCFAKQKQVSSDKISNKDFDIINEKLDKIMKALDIEMN